MKKSKLQEALEDLGHECQSYSGRCMYGETCVGVVIENSTSEFSIGFEVARHFIENDIELSGQEEHDFCRAKSDSMGRDTIIYWPDVQYVDYDDEDEDNEHYLESSGHSSDREDFHADG